jgi:type I restriction enzyme S subunit
MKAGWDRNKLGDVATLQRGFDLPTQDRIAGEFSIVSSSGVIDTHHKSAVRGPGVITGRSGSIGNVFLSKKIIGHLIRQTFEKTPGVAMGDGRVQ